MQTFRTPDQLFKHVEETRRADAPSRQRFSRDTGRSQCYYVGAQWIGEGHPSAVNQRQNGLGRLLTSWNPDSTKLRVTVNRVTKYVTKEAAATYPSAFEIDARPSVADSSLEGEYQARVYEQLAQIAVDQSAMLHEAQDANLNRAIAGTWGLGLFINNYTRVVDGQEIPDRCVKAFSFDPTRLILDPGNTSRRLKDHDEVVYEDVWTIAKVRRMLGVELNPERVPKFGQLAGNELDMARLSGGGLYSSYQQHSESPATIVAQVHCKDATGRHGVMYVMYKDERGEWQCPNFDSPESPFGGCGLPMVLIHGHRRPGSVFGIAAGQMTRDDQDRLNLLWSQFFRHQQKYSSPTIMADRRSFPNGTTDDDIRENFTNRIGGLVLMEQRAEKAVAPPQYLIPPPPPPYIQDIAEKFEADMREQVARAEGHFGLGTKSHVPYQTTERLLEEADQILGIRVQEDKAAYEDLLGVLAGTVVRFVQQDVPGTLVALRDRGFSGDDFGVLAGTDPYDLGGTALTIHESGIRYQSLASKRQGLDAALAAGAIDAISYRMELSSLDVGLTSTDRQMDTELTRAVERLVVTGEPWQPLPIGEYGQMAMSKLRRALFDRRVRDDPAKKMLVIGAIVMQQQALAMEQTLANPGLEGGSESGSIEEQQPPDTIGSLLAQVGGMMGGPSQPAPMMG